MTDPILYLAGPYRAGHGRTVAKNIAVARAAAIELFRRGYTVLCPHLNTALMDEDLPEIPDAEWLRHTLRLMHRCDAVVLVGAWQESEGARAERDAAIAAGLPVWYDLPPALPLSAAGHGVAQRANMEATEAIYK